MAFDEFEDPYHQKVLKGLDDDLVQNPNNVGQGGISGPDPFGTSAPAQPSGGYDLEKFRNAWYGKGDVNNVQGWLDQNKAFTSGVTIKNGQHAYDPSGKYIADLIGNKNNPNQAKHAQFLDGIGSNGKRRSGKAAKTNVRTAPTVGAPRPPANDFLAQIRQQIMERLGRMSQDPSLSDPTLAAQSAAYRRSRERGAQDQRAAAAERAAFNGTLQGNESSGGFDTELGGIREAAAEDMAGNDARLLGNEVQARRDEAMRLYSMALQSGDAEAIRATQEKLANLDAQLRREGMSQQNSQYYAGLNQQGQQFDDTFGRGLNRDFEDDYRWRVMYGLQ